MVPLFDHRAITPAIKYLKLVIPAKAGIQRYDWMPDRACPQLDWGSGMTKKNQTIFGVTAQSLTGEGLGGGDHPPPSPPSRAAQARQSG